MNEKHYASLDVARQLKDIRIEFIDSETVRMSFPLWENDHNQLGYRKVYLENKQWGINHGVNDWIGATEVPAPSLSEILDKLPVGYYIQKIHDINQKEIFICSNVRDKCLSLAIDNVAQAENAVDAAALMLIKLEEEKDGINNK